MAPLGLSVRLLPTSKKAKIVPYVGGGVDALFYQYEEYGDFIAFGDPELPIVADAFVSEGTAFGYHALGGLRVYLNRDFAIVGEGRYQWAKDDMGDDFSPNEPGLVNTIDLSGMDGHDRRARTLLTHLELRDADLAGHEARGVWPILWPVSQGPFPGRWSGLSLGFVVLHPGE